MRTEQIGKFYLGTESFPKKKTAILYDASNLTTHAIIIGMTGSGKTGLGICLLEEAALDHIPVIAIDPKGDIGNLALNFPNLQAKSFEPWADADTLRQNNISAGEWAEKTAALWKKGIEKTEQSQARMQTLKDANPVHIYTPGSSIGIPISLLANLAPPDAVVMSDKENYAQYLDATTSGLLSLLQEDSDSLSPTHTFLTQILKSSWDKKHTLSLETLIQEILQPPFKKIGVLSVDQVFPEKKRQALAMSLNNLLASPSFSGWRIGQPLDVQNLFYDQDRNPQTSVLNIAHLSDSERMFFITLLLNNLINWMRRQQGTSSLRAILYMDEIASYLPPSMNPPSKTLFLTLLKQARAFGLGLVLSTQNPIDLDYKALSNAGTWFIGKLQTAQDRSRVSDGLLSASENGIQENGLDEWFDKLGNRQFLLHNIHQNSAHIFETRWAMSYLAGPLNRKQIKNITASENKSSNLDNKNNVESNGLPVILPIGIATYYAPSKNNSGNATHYFPTIIATAKLFFNDKKSNTHLHQDISLQASIPEDDNDINWNEAGVLDITADQLQKEPQNPAVFHNANSGIQNKENWESWEDSFKTHLRQNQSLTLLYADDLDVYSNPGENEVQFRNRIVPLLKEKRDEETSSITQKYQKKQATLDKQIATAENRYSKEKNDVSQGIVSIGVSVVTTLLSVFSGTKKLSQRNLSKVGSALKKTGKFGKEKKDVEAAEEKLQILLNQKTQLEHERDAKLVAIQEVLDFKTTALSKKKIPVKSTDIQIQSIALLYQALQG